MTIRREALFCVVLICFTLSKSEDSFFIAREGFGERYNGQYVCVTNSSFALTWIDERTNRNMDYESTFVTMASELDLETKNFIRSSIVSTHPILDERWEALKTQETKMFSIVNGSHEYHLLTVINNHNNFNVCLSIRIERKGHIFLCDNTNPYKSNCYWLILQEYNEDEEISAIRKCASSQIPRTSTRYTEGLCTNKKIEITHPKTPRFLSNRKWSHFIISKQGNTISFKRFINDKTETIMQFEDPKAPINITSVIIQSRVSTGFWKLHTESYFYSNDVTKEIVLLPQLYAQNNSVCVAMHLLCSSCKIKLLLKAENRTIREEIYENQHLGRKQIKFIAENIFYPTGMMLTISSLNSSPNSYWGIDKVRSCEKQEYRKLPLLYPYLRAACQLISNPDNIIPYEDLSTPVTTIKNNCSEDTIGESCVPCSLLFDTCKAIKICYKNYCVCSAGYRNNRCQEECGLDRYGHGCQKFCDTCFTIPFSVNRCDNINGKCLYEEECTHSSNRRNCEIHFAYPPKILGVTYSTALVQQENFAVSYWADKKKIAGYEIEYYAASYDWIRTNQIYEFGKSVLITLSDLRPDTPYFVRSVIRLTSGLLQNRGSLEVSEFRTDCEKISSQNIKKILGSNNATILVMQNMSIACNFWIVYLKNTKENPKSPNLEPTYSNSSYIFFDYLNSSTEYILTFEGSNWMYQEKFVIDQVTTTVKDLLVYNKNESSIFLRWRPPSEPYILRTEVKSFDGTEIINSRFTPCKLWTNLHCQMIDNLKNNTEYIIGVSVRSNNSNFGKNVYISTVTRKERSEFPYDLKILWTEQNYIQLEWKHPNETNGDIKHFVIDVTSYTNKQTLISNKLEVLNNYKLTYYYQIDVSSLFPTALYKVFVYANNGFRGRATSRTITSPPDLPKLLGIDLLHISNDSIAFTTRFNQLRGKTENYRLILLISNKKPNLNFYKELQKYHLKDLTVLVYCNSKYVYSDFTFLIGKHQDLPGCQKTNNTVLEPGTTYSFTLILVNTYQGMTRDNVFTFTYKTISHTNPALYGLFGLLLVIPLIIICCLCRNRLKHTTRYVLGANDFSSNSLTELHEIRNDHTNLDSTKIFSKTITANNFESYVKKSLENEDLKKQHEILLNTRSIYDTVNDKFRVEYVDMKYKKGPQISKAYIVCKVPTGRELQEFWKLVWDENVKHLILLENVHTTVEAKLNKYWPNLNKTMRFGDIVIECTKCQSSGFYINRQFTIKYKTKSKEIGQLHLSLHQDDYLYLSSLNYIEFFQKMGEISYSTSSPILVHSSIGLQGAGFTLLCDMSLRILKKEGSVSVIQNLETIIQITPDMMFDYEHYLAVHAIIVDTLYQINTSIDCKSYDRSKNFKKSLVRKHLKYLRDTLWLDVLNTEEYHDRYIYFQVVSKTRSGGLLCEAVSVDKEDCPYLRQFKLFKINSGKYFVTTQPTRDSLSDFLSLVTKKKFALVITLNQDLNLWPTSEFPVKNVNSDTILTLQEIKTLKSYDWIIVTVSNKTMKYTLEILNLKNWVPPALVPPDLTDFMDFVTESNDLINSGKNVLVTCSNGIIASGLYIAMLYNMQQIREESVCDVCKCVRTVRRHYEDFLKEDEQYLFLLEASYKYIQECGLFELR